MAKCIILWFNHKINCIPLRNTVPVLQDAMTHDLYKVYWLWTCSLDASFVSNSLPDWQNQSFWQVFSFPIYLLWYENRIFYSVNRYSKVTSTIELYFVICK